MESVLFNIAVGVACGIFVAWIIFKIRHGSFRQYTLLMIQQAEKEICALQHKKSLELLQQERFISEENSRLDALQKRLESENERLKTERHQHQEERKAHCERQKDILAKEALVTCTLERASGLSLAQARNELLIKAEHATRSEIERTIIKLSKQLENEQELRAQKLLFCILERKSLGLTKEQFLEEIFLPDQSFIPRFIGKDGRNIKTLSLELDVNIAIEESPPRIIVSSYDPYRRALALSTIKTLISSEKITPHTIHQAFIDQQSSLRESIVIEGANVCKAQGITKALPADIVINIGHMKYRSTAGQNLLQHSIDVAELMAMAAHELHLRVDKAHLMGLFHDIGKTLPPSWGTSHALAGKHFLQQYNIDPEIINAVGAHHGEEQVLTNEAKLLPICDSLSARLYGTRNQLGVPFLHVARECERIAGQHEGVVAAWAHHAISHIELVVHHSPKTDISALQHQLNAQVPTLPVLIRSITVSKD